MTVTYGKPQGKVTLGLGIVNQISTLDLQLGI